MAGPWWPLFVSWDRLVDKEMNAKRRGSQEPQAAAELSAAKYTWPLVALSTTKMISAKKM